MAPTALPTKPARNGSQPLPTSGAESEKKASPARWYRRSSGEHRNALDLAAVPGNDRSEPPVRDDEIGAVHAAAPLLDHRVDRRIAVRHCEAPFRFVDADKIREMQGYRRKRSRALCAPCG
jgi:hypothetical protein